jgi:hypothetical protein
MIFFHKQGFDEILKFALDDASEVDHQSDSKLAQVPVPHQERGRRSEVSEEEFERRQTLVKVRKNLFGHDCNFTDHIQMTLHEKELGQTLSVYVTITDSPVY